MEWKRSRDWISGKDAANEKDGHMPALQREMLCPCNWLSSLTGV